MGMVVLLGSLVGACIFGINGFANQEKRFLLIPAIALFTLGMNEAYLDFIWESTVSAPIRADLLFTPFLMVAFLIWGARLLSQSSNKN